MEPLDFDALYRRHSADVFRFCLYLSGSQADAEDLTAETFVRAWTAQDHIRAETIKSYLFTIAKNLFLNSRRRSPPRAPLSAELPDPALSGDQAYEHKAALHAVLGAIHQLPAVDRAALVMRTIDELPYREIARVLGITETAAKVKVHRARAFLIKWRTSQHE